MRWTVLEKPDDNTGFLPVLAKEAPAMSCRSGTRLH